MTTKHKVSRAAVIHPMRRICVHTFLQTGTFIVAACLVLGTAPAHSNALSRSPHSAVTPLLFDTKPSVHNCSRHYFNQSLDHFTFKQDNGNWLQRYFIYDGYRNRASKTPTPIFFYGGEICRLDWLQASIVASWSQELKMASVAITSQRLSYRLKQSLCDVLKH